MSPQKRTRLAHDARAAAKEKKPIHAASEFTILVVDDNPLMREVYMAPLVRRGYRVCLACDGGEALDILTRRKVDVMVLDIMMPIIDGHRLLELMQEKNISTKVLALSSSCHGEVGDAAITKGATSFLSKGEAGNAELLATIEELIAG